MAVTPRPTTLREEQELAGFLGAHGLPRSASSQALANSIVVLQGAGTLYGFTAKSNKASAQFIQLFDAAGPIPADGAAPNAVWDIGATGTLGVYFGSTGRFCEQGIMLVNSSTLATKTIGSADCFFDVQYV